MTMTKIKLNDIRTEIKDSLEDDPIGMFVNWLVWFNGKKMVEDELLKT